MATTQTDRLSGLIGDYAFKTPVRVATTAAISLSGEQVIDGIAVLQNTAPTPPDRVLVKDQADQTLNGIYDVAAGAWARSKDFDGARDARKGTLVLVTDGTVNAGLIFRVTSAEPIQIDGAGASNITFSNSGLAASPAMAPVVASTTIAAALALLGVNVNSGFRNRLINGTPNVWQRGAGGSAVIAIAASSNSYTADRWALTTFANQACTVSQVAGLTNQSQFAANIQRNAGQTGVSVLAFEQPLTLDQIVALRGQPLYLSFVAKAGANFSAAGGLLFAQLFFGTGTAQRRGQTPYTGETASTAIAAALTPTAAAFSGSLGTVPLNATQASLQFYFTPVGTAGTDDSFTICEMQAELGGAATVFERRPFEVELAQCLRFYQKTFVYSTAPAQNVGASTNEYYNRAVSAGATSNTIPIYVSPALRATPTVTLFNPGAANAQIRDETAGADYTSTSAAAISRATFVVIGTGPAGGSVGNRMGIHFTAEAEI